ncbi:hypothetical protein E1293_03255 [Actinomadura darangshiensis]|uniref:Uncharacterized protein n=1 Tax=Actinomadura darangshiensis TaxID=705336 RepID=A0A4R5BXK7_9ACTN|nr:hypothetical protein [Actinomadura darangshiensis]TDD90413.1 hypothetical protein E1293_03255 [Actinomadura darangshiensis]
MSDPCLTEVGWTGSALRLAGRLKPNGAVPEIELLLRERDGDGLLRMPASVERGEGHVLFKAQVDVSCAVGGDPLPGGLWEAALSIGAPMERSVVPLGRDRAPGLDASPRRRFLPGSCTVIVYFGADGDLTIDVGGRSHVAGSVAADALSWDERREEIIVGGHLGLRELSAPVSATLILAERHSRHTYEVIAMLEDRPGRLGYTAAVPVTRAFIDDPLPRGTWDVSLCLGFSGMHREMRLLAPGEPVDVQVWRRLRHVRVVSTSAPGPLTITVGRV